MSKTQSPIRATLAAKVQAQRDCAGQTPPSGVKAAQSYNTQQSGMSKVLPSK